MDFYDKVTVSRSRLAEVMGYLDGVSRLLPEDYEPVIDEAREKLRQLLAEADSK